MSKMLFKSIIISLILFPSFSFAEPVIVFPRTSSSLVTDGNTNNPFIIDKTIIDENTTYERPIYTLSRNGPFWINL